MSEYIYASDGKPMASENGNISIPREPLVRCSDCRYFAAPHECRRYGMFGRVDVDGFCKWGERRGE